MAARLLAPPAILSRLLPTPSPDGARVEARRCSAGVVIVVPVAVVVVVSVVVRLAACGWFVGRVCAPLPSHLRLCRHVPSSSSSSSSVASFGPLRFPSCREGRRLRKALFFGDVFWRCESVSSIHGAGCPPYFQSCAIELRQASTQHDESAPLPAVWAREVLHVWWPPAAR